MLRSMEAAKLRRERVGIHSFKNAGMYCERAVTDILAFAVSIHLEKEMLASSCQQAQSATYCIGTYQKCCICSFSLIKAGVMHYFLSWETEGLF